MDKIISAIAIACLCFGFSSCDKTQETDNNAEVSGVQQNLPVYKIAQSDTSTINKELKSVLVISASGMGRKGAVEQSRYMQEAYNLGKTI